MFFLLCFHILTPAKKLIFEGLIHWVVGHGDKTRRSGGVIGNYQSFGDGRSLESDVVKPSQIADELFCLVIPTDDANYSLLNFLSHWIVGALTASMYLQNKQENGGGPPIASPMPKSDQGIRRVKESVFYSKECHTSFVVIPPFFMEEEDDLISMESM